MKVLSPKAPLYLYQSIIRPCIECSYHVSAGAASCYLDILDKLQRQVWTSFVGDSLAISHELLSRCRNIGSSDLFCRYCFGRRYMNWLNCFQFFIITRGPLVIIFGCMIFLSLFINIIRMSLSTNSFNSLAQLDRGIITCKMLSFDIWSKWSKWLELIDTPFILRFFRNIFASCFFIFVFSFNL